MRLALSLVIFVAACPAWADNSHLVPEQVVADAIRRVEGGSHTRWPYGVKSCKVSSEAEAKQVCLNSIRNSRARWVKAGRPGSWLEFMAARWCPKSADPVGYENWLRNMRAILNCD